MQPPCSSNVPGGTSVADGTGVGLGPEPFGEETSLPGVPCRRAVAQIDQSLVVTPVRWVSVKVQVIVVERPWIVADGRVPLVEVSVPASVSCS